MISLLAVAIDEQENIYIVTELLERHSLRQFLSQNKGCVSFEVKLNIIFQTARALDYIHSLNPPLMHRDVKPLNIFIGKDFSVKIGDFGLAKEFSQEPKCKINSDTISTLEYMSPETLDQGVYRPESDIYSFGVLMYEVLSEQSFMRKGEFDLIQAIVIRKERPSLQNIE